MAKIKDLAEYLNKSTGTTQEERVQWRDDLSILKAVIDKESDPAKKQELVTEYLAVFNSFSYWREKKIYEKSNVAY